MNVRRHISYDSKFKADFIRRVCVYWFLSLIVVTFPLVVLKTTQGQTLWEGFANVGSTHWPVLVLFTTLLPMVIIDALKFTNRFVGPIQRLQTDLDQYVVGQPLNEIKFREDDVYERLPDAINTLINRVQELEQHVQMEAETG